MHKKIIAIGLLFFMALLTGCATVGTPTSQIAASKTSQIIVGQSTRADVRATMGEPRAVYRSFRGEQTWEYPYYPELSDGSKIAAGAGLVHPLLGLPAGLAIARQTTVCYILFDDKGIVKSVECK